MLPALLALLALGQMDGEDGPILSRPKTAQRAAVVTVDPNIVLMATLSTSSECSGAVPTATVGGTLTYTRASAAVCMTSTGVATPLSNNQPITNSFGYLPEPSATNLALRNRDLSNVVWVAVNATCTKTATGRDNVANSASTCTASAADGTVLQVVTVASALRSTSFDLKRRTGTGSVYVTRDNGSTWIDVTASVTANWGRVTPTTHAGLATTAANPIIGIKLATSGDAVDIDYVQDEAGGIATSRIETAGASASRSAAVLTAVTPAGLSRTEGCAKLDIRPQWTTSHPGGSYMLLFATNARAFYAAAAASNISANDGAAAVVVAAGFTSGTTKTYRTLWSATGNAKNISNVTSSTSGTPSAFTTFPAFAATVFIGSDASSTTQASAYLSNLVVGKTTASCP